MEGKALWIQAQNGLGQPKQHSVMLPLAKERNKEREGEGGKERKDKQKEGKESV